MVDDPDDGDGFGGPRDPGGDSGLTSRRGRRRASPSNPDPVNRESFNQSDGRSLAASDLDRGGSRPGSGDSVTDREPLPDVSRSVAVRHVIVFKGKPVAVGLDWRLAEDLTKARAVAVERAQTSLEELGLDQDLWCFNAGTNDAQVGMGSSEFGHRAGHPALAAEVASRMPVEWVGVFKIDGIFYVLSARGGTIDPESDVAFIDAAEAKKTFIDLRGSSSGMKLYASPDLLESGFCDGVFDQRETIEPLNLEEVVERFSIRLQHVSAFKRIRPHLMTGAAVLAVLYILTALFPNQWLALKVKLGLSQAKQEARVVIPPMPWTGQPKAPDVIKACLAAFRAVPADPAGWHGNEIICDGRKIGITVSRPTILQNGSPIGWLLDTWSHDHPNLIDSFGQDLGKVTFGKITGSKIEMFWSLKPLPRWREQDGYRAETIDKLEMDLWKAIESHYESSSFVHPPVNRGSGGYAETRGLKVTTNLVTAADYEEIFNKNSMTVTSMKYDTQTGAVVIDVRFHYAKTIPSGHQFVRQPDPRTVESGPVPAPEL